MKSKSIKRHLLFSTMALLLLAFVVNTGLTAYIVKKESQSVLIDKAKEQVFEMAKQAEVILNTEGEPLESLQAFVETKAKQSNVTYAIVIDTNVSAVAVFVKRVVA